MNTILTFIFWWLLAIVFLVKGFHYRVNLLIAAIAFGAFSRRFFRWGCNSLLYSGIGAAMRIFRQSGRRSGRRIVRGIGLDEFEKHLS